MTSPKTASANQSPDVKYGVANKMWLELEPYPAANNPRSLWLLVDRAWVRWNLPDLTAADNDPKNARVVDCCKLSFTVQAVQSAFCNCPDKLEVAVWYTLDYVLAGATTTNPDVSRADKSGVVVGLVVRSK